MLSTLEMVPGCISPGIFILSPSIHGITFADGLWNELSVETGLLFDFAEEQEVQPDKLREVSIKMQRFNYKTYMDKVGQRVVDVGEVIAPIKKSLQLSLSYEELYKSVEELAEFIEDAEEKADVLNFSL